MTHKKLLNQILKIDKRGNDSFLLEFREMFENSAKHFTMNGYYGQTKTARLIQGGPFSSIQQLLAHQLIQ